MKEIDKSARFLQAAGCLSRSISQRLAPLAPKLGDTAQEIRMRINRPLTIVCPSSTYYVTKTGGLVSAPIQGSMLGVSRSDIADTFQNICNYSVYARQNEIVNGFITMHGGHRAGICGTAVMNGEKLGNIRDITSINVRIAREHRDCAKSLAKFLSEHSGGALLCGAPCSGKTTVLRDLARLFSTEYQKNVSLIDERGELASTSSGVFQNDVGMCDVFDCYKKSTAMLQSIRSMAPDIIICDEIGSDDDISAIEQAVNCGAGIIASVHAANESELRQKPGIVRLVKKGAFSTVVFLSSKNTPGEVVKILQAGDIFGS